MGKDLKGKELGQGLSQRKDGLYSARFLTKSGKRKEQYFKKLNEAKKWLEDSKYKDTHDPIRVPNSMTVEDLFEVWLSNLQKRAKYNTYRIYRETYIKRIQPYIRDVKLQDIKPMHCQLVLNKGMDKDYATETLQKMRSVMSMAFDMAVDNGLILSNPVTKNITFYKKEKKEKRIFTLSEQKAFMEQGGFSVHFDEFVFILNTGLRCGEMSALTWDDVDWENRTITINHTMFLNTDTNEFMINVPKTKAGRRTIPLTTQAYSILLKRKRNKEKLVSLEYKNYIFLTGGTPTRACVYNRSLYAITRRIGIESISMHGLRHTFATRCIETGMKPKVLQVILGHSNIAMTMDLYVHVTEDETKNEMGKFELGIQQAQGF